MLDADQLAAVEAASPVVVARAGAGAGKTTVLVERARRAVEAGRKVLLLAFTRAAAIEMRRRLPDHNAQITTLHGWCSEWLAKNHLQAGLPQHFTVRDQAECDDLWLLVGAELKLKQRTAKAISRVSEAKHRYAALLRASASVDYAMLLDLALLLLTRGIRPEIDEVLVDEAQDLSRQDQILVGLLAEGRALFVVGDTSQALFDFRGGDASWFSELAAERITLPRNYRSDAQVVAAASAICLTPAPVRQVPVSLERGWVGTVIADALPEHVRNLLGGDWDRGIILGRTWKAVDAAAAEIKRAGIPAVVVCPGALFSTPSAKLLLAVLRCVVNPDDRLSLHTVIGGRVTQEQISGAVQAGQPIVEWVTAAAAAGTPAAIARALREEYLAGAWTGAGLALVAISQIPGIADAVRDAFEVLDDDLSLREAVSAAVSADAQSLPAPDGRVQLTTIHAAKGREWDHVWVLGCSEPVVPFGEGTLEEVESERRLFYVATTRARQTCGWVHGRDERVSRFVAEALVGAGVGARRVA